MKRDAVVSLAVFGRVNRLPFLAALDFLAASVAAMWCRWELHKNATVVDEICRCCGARDRWNPERVAVMSLDVGDVIEVMPGSRCRVIQSAFAEDSARVGDRLIVTHNGYRNTWTGSTTVTRLARGVM